MFSWDLDKSTFLDPCGSACKLVGLLTRCLDLPRLLLRTEPAILGQQPAALRRPLASRLATAMLLEESLELPKLAEVSAPLARVVRIRRGRILGSVLGGRLG